MIGHCWRCETMKPLVIDPMFSQDELMPTVCRSCAYERIFVAVIYKNALRMRNA